MSYILDALKKSEEKRKQERDSSIFHSSPTVGARQQTVRPSGTAVKGLIYMSIFFAFLIFTGYFLFAGKSTPPPAVVTPLPDPPVPPQPTSELPAQEVLEEIPELRAIKKKMVIEPQAEQQKEILQPTPIVSSPLPQKTIQETSNINRIPYLEELPAEDKEPLPEFKLAGHAYSPNPKLRMILINNSIVRENDIVEKDFILEEITPDGVILRSGSIRFRIDAD